MKFSSHEDIEAPAQVVFAALYDHEHFQRTVQQRGVEMRRVDDRPEVGPGMAWLGRLISSSAAVREN